MHVNKGVDAFFSQFVDQVKGFLEVDVIVDTLGPLYSFPHDTQSD